MAQAKGSRSQVTIQKEDSFGVAPGTPEAQLLYYSTCSLALNRARNRTIPSGQPQPHQGHAG